MISRLAAKLAAYFTAKGTIREEDSQACGYGFELLIATAINCAFICIGAIIMGIFPHTLLYLVGLIPLRFTAGGYHAKHHWSFILISCIAYTITAFPLRYIPIDMCVLYNLTCCIFVSMAVFMLSPVEAVNKPLSAKKRESVRNWSIGIVSFGLFICLIPVFIELQVLAVYLTYYVTGATLAGISLIVVQKNGKVPQ